jgi:hypothetical protein
MTQEDYKHPIAPPPELVQQWETDWHCSGNTDGNGFTSFVVTTAAQWGADQELEACCKWLPKLSPWSGDDLRRHRRPKPPSLKEQALALLEVEHGLNVEDLDLLRRALEQLPDNE